MYTNLLYLLHVFKFATTAAVHDPMCTIGASGPTARLEDTAHTVPSHFVTRVRKDSRSGTKLPLR